MVYYNEFDPFAAQWLRNLIAAGHLPGGDVDERDIREVTADDLKGYTQCHFFAGIGGWALAVRTAGLEDVKGLWTGSPPCQPFSVAGKGKGVEDERHLAPTWLELIRERKPKYVFGEQVAAAVAKDGWLDTIQDALEEEGYATGQVVLPACSVGAPHLRQRLWFVAVGNTKVCGCEQHKQQCGCAREEDNAGASNDCGVDNYYSLGNTRNPRLEGHWRPKQVDGSEGRAESYGHSSARGINSAGDTTNTGWEDCDWLYCRDEKWRCVEPGTFPLADGIPNRVGRLRAYGNAIVPQVAAEVLLAAFGGKEE